MYKKVTKHSTAGNRIENTFLPQHLKRIAKTRNRQYCCSHCKKLQKYHRAQRSQVRNSKSLPCKTTFKSFSKRSCEPYVISYSYPHATSAARRPLSEYDITRRSANKYRMTALYHVRLTRSL